MIKDPTMLKVAIVHDWLIGGGAERVVLELHRMFPEAPIYTSYATKEWREKLANKVVTGVLQYWPFSKLRKFIPLLRIWWFSRLKLKGYDLVISSSGAEAKGIKVPEGTIHINYCHAPTHYYWGRYEQYLLRPGFGIFDPLARLGLRLLVSPLRQWDWRAAQRPKYLLANSTYTQDQIKKYYDRDSIVIHPPIDISRFQNSGSKIRVPVARSGFVITGRQTPYKRIDLAVAACSEINVPLKVIGNGPDHDKLVAMAGPTITFLNKVTDDEMPEHLRSANAFIFPGIDDFGISAVEAMAAGTPVIAYKAGGAMDYVIAGETGMFFEKPTVQSLSRVIASFNAKGFDKDLISRKAEEFSPEVFQRNVFDFINKMV